MKLKCFSYIFYFHTEKSIKDTSKSTYKRSIYLLNRTIPADELFMSGIVTPTGAPIICEKILLR